MKRFLYAALSVVMAFFLSGCIQDTIVIHLKPDGSGTVDETFLFSNTMFDMMESLAGTMARSVKQEGVEESKDATKGDEKKDARQTRDDIIAKMAKDAEKGAGAFGSKVKFLSAIPVKTDTGSGYRAVYAFDDISDVRVNQNLWGKVGHGSDAPVKEESVLFRFVKGSPAGLIVTLPSDDTAVGDKSGTSDGVKPAEGKSKKDTSVQGPEMMKSVFQDMKLAISIQFEGTIVKTNATYRDGSTITLMDMDMGKIMSNATLFKQILLVNPQSIGETKAYFKGVEGLKLETINPVTVEFK